MSMSDKLKLIKISLQEGADEAAKKSKELLEYSELSIAIAACDKSINDLYMEIGKKVYKMHKNNEEHSKKIMQYCEEIEELEEEKKKIKKKILKLKNKRECKNCGFLINKKAQFCDKCGSRQ